MKVLKSYLFSSFYNNFYDFHTQKVWIQITLIKKYSVANLNLILGKSFWWFVILKKKKNNSSLVKILDHDNLNLSNLLHKELITLKKYFSFFSKHEISLNFSTKLFPFLLTKLYFWWLNKTLWHNLIYFYFWPNSMK